MSPTCFCLPAQRLATKLTFCSETGELQYLSRNKEMQARYEEWIGMQKETWGSSGESLAVLGMLGRTARATCVEGL